MAQKNTNLAIMFADISGSTKLYEVLGDHTARLAVAETLDTIAEIVERHKGTVIKTIGDEIMCTYADAEAAATAACEMQETLEENNESGETKQPVSIRVGMHFGPAIMEGGDVFGDAVNVAARMAAQAKARQIMTTKSTIELLPSILRASTRFVDYAPIKGKKEDIEIFEIIWQQEDVTRMATGMMSNEKKPPGAKMRLRYHKQDVILNHERSSVVMGRSQGCDLPINEKLASRQHVRIELRRDKFFIIDQSTNGTYVRINDSGDAFLRREEIPLTGKGLISLGRAFTEDPVEVVQFFLEQE
ncbi:MAG: adenylate/guanylate cyclase domain-containing protein [Gammaproteobacteria bacterium]